jgi:hypothetical protein
VCDEVKGALQGHSVGLHRRALAADVEGEPREPHTGGDDVFDEKLSLGGVDTEFRGQIRLRVRIAKRQTHEQLDVGRPARELVCLARVFDDERPDARRVCVIDVFRLFDRVGVDAPLHRQPELCKKIDLSAGGHVKTATADGDRGQHERMRLRFYGVVEVEGGQLFAEVAVPPCDQVRLQHQQWGAVPLRQCGQAVGIGT